MGRLAGVGISLGGGAATGYGLQLGFASALELFLLSHDVADFDTFAGISSGSILSAYLGAGISPLDIMQAQLLRPNPTEFVPFKWSDFFEPNFREIAETPIRVGRAIVRAAAELWRASKQGFDAPAVLGVLPSAPLRNDRLGAVIRKNLEQRGANDFRTFPRRYVTCFYDLLGNERVVCGTEAETVRELPVHEAVLASSTIPAIFAPRRVRANGRTMLGVDGGTAGLTLTTDGAEGLHAPFTYNNADYIERDDIEHASALSMLFLSLRLLKNQRNMEQITTFIDRNPAQHVIPFESPVNPEDHGFSFDAAVGAVRPEFERTTRALAERADYLALVLEPLGVRLNPEIADLRYEDALMQGRKLKLELRKRHGID